MVVLVRLGLVPEKDITLNGVMFPLKVQVHRVKVLLAPILLLETYITLVVKPAFY